MGRRPGRRGKRLRRFGRPGNSSRRHGNESRENAPMNAVLPVVLLLVGIVVGVVATWLVWRLKLQHEADLIRGAVREDVVRLEGRLSTAAEQIRAADAMIESQKLLLQEERKATQAAEERSR